MSGLDPATFQYGIGTDTSIVIYKQQSKIKIHEQLILKYILFFFLWFLFRSLLLV